MTKPMLILVAGPYRSGTGDDPDLMAPTSAASRRRPGRSSAAGTFP